MIFIETRDSLKIGFALTGSFCTFSAVLPQIEKITAAGIEIVPIMSEKAYSTDTRFGTSAEFISKIEKITGNKVLHRQTEVEPIGPKKMIDALVIAPVFRHDRREDRQRDKRHDRFACRKVDPPEQLPRYPRNLN